MSRRISARTKGEIEAENEILRSENRRLRLELSEVRKRHGLKKPQDGVKTRAPRRLPICRNIISDRTSRRIALRLFGETGHERRVGCRDSYAGKETLRIQVGKMLESKDRTLAELKAALGKSRFVVLNALRPMIKDGACERIATGIYRIGKNHNRERMMAQ